MSAIQKMMQELEPEYIKIRRYLHQHPELSFQEENTTKFIKDELNKYGIEVYDNKRFYRCCRHFTWCNARQKQSH